MNITAYTASDARKSLYTLIKKASKGLTAIEINLRNSEPVVMINKAEMESWLETLDVMSSPEEIKAIRKGLKSKKSISLDQLQKELGI